MDAAEHCWEAALHAEPPPEVAAHLKRCPACSRRAETIQRVIATVRAEVPPPPFLRPYEDVYRLARHVLKDDDEAEDAVQATLFKLLQGLTEHRVEADFRTWLLCGCGIECFDLTQGERIPGQAGDKKGRELRSVSLDDLRAKTQDGSTDEESRCAGDSRPWVSSIDCRTALLELPSEEHEAWFLVDAIGLTREEAARLVGVPPPRIRAAVTSARERLLVALGEAPAPELDRGERVDVWGVYHSPHANALVISFGPRTATASYRHRRNVEQLLGVLSARSDFAASSLSRDGYDLFGFLDRLDGEIPSNKRMFALIDHCSEGQHDAVDWVAGHPGWSGLRLSQREWRKEVEHLLNRCTSRSAGRIHGVLTPIDGREPFVWIKTEQERLK